MQPLKRAAIAVRPRSLLSWTAPVLLVTIVLVGCGHKRAAMRPVIVGPPTVVTPSSAPCPANDPDCVPAAGPSYGQPGELDNAMPAAPGKASGSVVPPNGEPILEPTTPGLKSGSNESPVASPPTTLNNTNSRTRPAAGVTRRSDASARVAAFVNDPNDLLLPPKADRPWRYLVLHHSAHSSGSYAQIDRDHRERLGTQGCGYHFVIGNGSETKDGQIEVTKRWSDQKAGAHCRDAKTAEANDYGIGICLIGNLENEPPSPRQIEATKALVAYLRDRYGIAPERIVSHAAIAETATSCPGKLFPTEVLSPKGEFAVR